jgi:hypothetical protein
MTHKQSKLEFNQTLQKIVPQIFNMPIFALQYHPNIFKKIFLDLISWLFGIFCPILAIVTFLSAIKSKKLSFEVFKNCFNNIYMLTLTVLLTVFSLGYLILLISFDVLNQNAKTLTHVKDLIFQKGICSDLSLAELLAQHLLLNSELIKFSGNPKQDCLKHDALTLLPFWEIPFNNSIS